jgi:hypothetical protein
VANKYLSPEERADREEMLREMVADGSNIGEIAEVMGISETTVSQLCKKLGIFTENVQKAHKHNRMLSVSEMNRLRRMRLDGASFITLSQEFSLSIRYLTKIIKMHKIPYGRKCEGCGTQVTEDNRPKNLWKWCENCFREKFNERCNSYIMGRYHEDAGFRQKLLAGMKKYQRKSRRKPNARKYRRKVK